MTSIILNGILFVLFVELFYLDFVSKWIVEVYIYILFLYEFNIF